MTNASEMSEMRFLQKIKGVTMFDTKISNTAIREFLNIESPLLQIERSQHR